MIAHYSLKRTLIRLFSSWYISTNALISYSCNTILYRRPLIEVLGVVKKVIGTFIGMIIILTIISLSLGAKSEDNTIVIGAKDFPEQYLLGEMLAILIEEHTDLDVERKFGYGLEDIYEPLFEGEIDLYPEYTGTGWAVVLDKPFIYNPNILYQEVKRGYDKEFDVKWLDRFGFNNTFGLAMKNDQAIEKGIYTYSDLALKGRPLSIGAASTYYNRKDAYPGLVEQYGLELNKKRYEDINEKYDAINSGEVDVIDVNTTDGLLETYDLRLLVDDQNYFAPYEAATIIRKDTLEKHPELEEVLNKLGGQITNEEMSMLNNLMESSDMEIDEIARLFLQSKGLI